MGKKLTRQEWLERNKKLPIALIEKPLKYILNRTTTRDEKGGQVLDPKYIAAYEFAKAGQGQIVQQIAKSV